MYIPAVFLAASMFVQFFAEDRRSKLLKVSLGLLLLMLVSMVLVAGK
ncbi:MAG: hypothetical protein AAF196_15690 [Planctomycetota bacterium]